MIRYSHPWPYITTFHPCLGRRDSKRFSNQHVKKAGLMAPLWLTNFEIYYVGFEFPIAVGMQCAALWNVTPHSFAGDYQFLAEACRLRVLTSIRWDEVTQKRCWQRTRLQCHNSEHFVHSCHKDLLNFRTLFSCRLLDSSDIAIFDGISAVWLMTEVIWDITSMLCRLVARK